MSSTQLDGAAQAPARPWPLTAQVAIAWLVLIALIGVAAPLLAPHAYAQQFPLSRLLPPMMFETGEATFPFGTDHLGRCVLSRTIYAIRFSLLVALVGTAIGAVLGTLLGLLAGQLRGWFEEAVMALVDIFASIPFIVLALCVIAFFGADFVVFLVVLGLAGWERYARLARALVLDANTRGYAEAARNLGIAPLTVVRRHLAPNIVGPLMVQVTINFPETMLLETGLSFLGLGVQPPLTSLGLMISEAKDLLPLTAWPAVPAAVAIFGTTLAVSLLGDHLRDRSDSALRAS
jgi:peptide/nickel transport system permease protein